ncbi:CoA transferase [Gordonia alkaliphila]|uniref:CaiB/BaiF CoA transferase family protein n=1 Tax=Gordonia alkaliphila TaxID=1053547 RepID=UPI001FF3D091|nr:CaiB/BaiF CoA-transferase family protein [Gordonia alkaliphila]MCK0439118.1 CoA transferase [Gordonia alkaliphila]
MTLPLDGFTVVSVEQAVAAPLATRQLADLGARVIKVERPDGGDLARGYDDVVAGTGAHFVWLNRGKESLAVDLKAAAGRKLLRQLIDDADVFVQNLAPGAAERLGLGAATLRADHPELITVDMSGYGVGGPYSQRKAYDMLVQAEAGLIAITGTPETAVKTGIPTADIASGMYCAQAVLAALLRRSRTGEGAQIEVSMLESTVEWMGYPMYSRIHTGVEPPRMGVGHVSIAPYNAYPTSDGEILIGVQSENGWRALMSDVLGRPDLIDDPRFATNIDRVRHRDECDAVVAALTVEWTAADLSAHLADAGVPAAAIKDVGTAVEHPQLRARDRWRTVDTEHAAVEALLPPATFADFEAPMGAVPALGADTRTVLASMGCSPDEIDALVADGVVGD